MPLEIHVVSHTHWDREWYHTAEVFRHRLVRLVDDLIDAPPAVDESFLLDGQTVVLSDYLEVRPDRRNELATLLREGRIEAGPWFVLADELIPSGEALVRNLLAGRRDLERFGASSPPVLYCPDSFGHPAALPEIAAGFGLPLIVLWRGYGGVRWPRGDVVKWQAPSGAEALVFHLPPAGYELGASLPVDEDAAATRWTELRAILAPRATVGVTLLHNGADHHARQRDRDAAVSLVRQLATETKDRARSGSLRSFADALVARASAQRVPLIKGELRDSYGYTWTLQGTLGTRAGQKRRNAMAERLLVRVAEPWSALEWFVRGKSPRHGVHAAWRTLLLAHPHDTLCGTSIDEVAVAVDARLGSAALQAGVIAGDAIASLLGRDVAAERDQPADWEPMVVVRNDQMRSAEGVTIVELIEKVADEPVGPGSGKGPRFEELAAAAPLRPVVPPGMQLLSTRIGRERIESPAHYPDNDVVRVSSFAARMASVPALSLTPSAAPGSWLPLPAQRVRVSTDEMSNTIINCRFAKRGPVTIESNGRSVANVLRFEDRSDRGDLYTPSIGSEIAAARLSRRSTIHRGPLLGEVRQQWKLVPSGKRSSPGGVVAAAWRVLAGSPVVEVAITGTNIGSNHRLRVGFASGMAGATVVADAAFGSADRAPIVIPAAEAKVEHAPPTAPLHRYVSLFNSSAGFTLFSDGLAEYEVDRAGIVWVTLVRAVGDLSRNDLPERPGHAGWPVDTPAAQSIGPFEARFAVLMHGGRTPATVDEIERECDRFLHPLRAFTVRSALTVPAPVSGPSLSGAGLAVSTIKQSEDGRWLVLRCVNRLDRAQTGQWKLPREISEAKLARLDETPIGDATLGTDHTVVPIGAGPRAVVTLLVR